MSMDWGAYLKKMKLCKQNNQEYGMNVIWEKYEEHRGLISMES